jgi:hypothetical protein
MKTRSTLLFFSAGTLAFSLLHCGGESSEATGGASSTGSSGGTASTGSAGGAPLDPCSPTSSTPPAAPSSLAVESSSSYEVTLTWAPSPDAAVKRYRVLRGAAQVGLVDKPRFAHRPVVPGETYEYTVTALAEDGAESPATSPVSVTVPAAVAGPIDSLAPNHWCTRSRARSCSTPR